MPDPNVAHKRGDRAAFTALKGSSGLVTGQIYFITDDNVLALATSSATAVEYLGETAVVALINALKAQATITVDAGSVASTARPTGWGAVQWIRDNGVVLENVEGDELNFERGA